MPVYEYKCKSGNMDCYGLVVEVLKPVSQADKPEHCKHCEAPMERLMSRGEFRMRPLPKD